MSPLRTLAYPAGLHLHAAGLAKLGAIQAFSATQGGYGTYSESAAYVEHGVGNEGRELADNNSVLAMREVFGTAFESA